MEKQVVDRLTIETLIPTTDTESLAKGYILNCKSEGKSPKTIAIYEIVLKNFIWYCKQNNFPEAQQLTSVHIRHFLWYLSSETNRWGSNNPAARQQTSTILPIRAPREDGFTVVSVSVLDVLIKNGLIITCLKSQVV